MEAKLKIESWDEKPYRELDEGGKLTRADVLLSGPDDGLMSATSESLMFYRADGTSAYVTVMHITGMLGGLRAASYWRDTAHTTGQRHAASPTWWRAPARANWPD